MISQELLTAAERKICKESFFEFIVSFWPVIIPDPPVFNWHIKFLADELQTIGERIRDRKPKEYDLVINVPPASTKTTIATIMFPAWLWVIDPSIRIISSSYSAELSLDHSVKSRDILRSDKFGRLFPEVVFKADKDGKKNYANNSTGMRYATSTGGTVTGMHGHIIIQDDPLSPKQSTSEVEIVNANTFLDKTLSSRMVDRNITPIITIMQRLAENDVTGHILAKHKKSIKHICLPAEDFENVKPASARANYVGGLLDPVRLSRSVLAKAKIELGSYGYAGQFMQLPAPEDGGYLRKNWFEIIPFPADKKLVWNIAIDPAYTAIEANDPSGLMAYANDGADIIIRNYENVRKEFPALVNYIVTFANTNGGDDKTMVAVEPKASGKSIVQVLKQSTGLNVVEAPNPTKDKVARVKDIAPRCEAGRVKLVLGAWNENFLYQITTFPNAAHDEEVDCLGIAMSKRPKQLGKSKGIGGTHRGLRRM